MKRRTFLGSLFGALAGLAVGVGSDSAPVLRGPYPWEGSVGTLYGVSVVRSSDLEGYARKIAESASRSLDKQILSVL